MYFDGSSKWPAVTASRRMYAQSLFCSGGQNDYFRPLTYTLGGRDMGCRDKYVTS
jgi:hypothetical protein